MMERRRVRVTWATKKKKMKMRAMTDMMTILMMMTHLILQRREEGRAMKRTSAAISTRTRIFPQVWAVMNEVKSARLVTIERMAVILHLPWALKVRRRSVLIEAVV